MQTRRIVVGVLVALAAVASVQPVAAQQRPLATEDPETIGEGRVLLEGGIDYAHDQVYTVSGLRGNLWRAPTLGVSIGVSSIAEIQLDGGLFNHLSIRGRTEAPLSSAVTASGGGTSDVEDVVFGTKVRLMSETDRRPAVGFRFATRLPNASNESGLGTDTTDFLASLLVGKTVRSVRVVGNLGVGILADPTRGDRQNDVLTYGLSLARALTGRSEAVGELNGRVSTRTGVAFPGTESRGALRFGTRYTRGALRLDTGVFVGLTEIDPTVGLTVGFTYVLDAFTVP